MTHPHASHPNITRTTAAKQLGFASKVPIDKLIAAGHLQAYMIGHSKLVRLRQEDIDALIVPYTPNGDTHD